jgi:hypothetical protein
VVSRFVPKKLRTAPSLKSIRSYSILTHIGRRSGVEYMTPVAAYPLGDGFVFALLNGVETDWCRNVVVAGNCTLIGQEIRLEKPELISPEQALVAYPSFWKFSLRTRNIQQFMWVHRQAETHDLA